MTRLLSTLLAASTLSFSGAAFAQDRTMDNMPGMVTPGGARPAQENQNDKAAGPRANPTGMPASATSVSDGAGSGSMQGMDHQGHDMSTMPGMDMPGMPGMKPAVTPGMEMAGTTLTAGNAPAPAVPMDHFADRDFPADEMARSRAAMMKEQGATLFGQVLLNVFEYQARKDGAGYRWDGEGWYGGDINRLWIKSEGEGTSRGGLETGEVQALYGRAVGPYFNLQAGVRQDFGRGPDRTYATVGIEGLAPGFFEVESALFLSNRGDLLARAEGYYDQRITQRLILQPRAELNFSMQDVPSNRIGSGLVDYELGARLRYEFTRQFAPYVGVSFERKTGRTARFARSDGEGTGGANFVAGLRFWF